MPIVGHGLDLVEVSRIESMLERHGDRFRTRVFTPGELAHGAGARREGEHLAARFAAKEATLKALGTGLAGGIAWTDVEIVREASGRPTLVLHGEAARRATHLGIVRWHLSITHAGGTAMASVVGETA
jgi:holo-[acyl-carrier protein] synthase